MLTIEMTLRLDHGKYFWGTVQAAVAVLNRLPPNQEGRETTPNTFVKVLWKEE